MPSRPFSRALSVLVGALSLVGCGPMTTPEPSALVIDLDDDAWRRVFVRSPVPEAPLDETNALSRDDDAIALGRILFSDARLSIDGENSCASCHDADHGFADPRPLSIAIGTTTRHAPTVLNAAHQRWFFWDGRADSLWSQALGPFENPIEMGNDRVNVLRTIFLDDTLRTAFEAITGPMPPLDDTARFPEHARPDVGAPDAPHAQAWSSMSEDDRTLVDRAFSNVGKCIAAFEETLIATRSSFDTFVEGVIDDDNARIAALDESAQRGLALFVGKAGCTLCHTGPLFSDLEFHNIAVPDAAYDPGRSVGVLRVLNDPMNALGVFSDDTTGPRAARLRHLAYTPEQDGQMKTPSLRNVALSPPYMHDGSLATLEDVVRFYSELPGVATVGHREDSLIPLALTDDEIDDLVSFLESLTDESLAQAPAGSDDSER
jgi:cytochrome c peroxidase